jgi:hypothetical protein
MKNMLFVIAITLMSACGLSTPAQADYVEVTKVVHTGDSNGDLNGKYLLVSLPSARQGTRLCINFHVVGSTLQTPCPSGTDSLVASISPNASNEDVSFAMQDALVAYDNQTYETLGGNAVDQEEDGDHEFFIIYNFYDGAAMDGADGNTGWAVSVYQDGQDI